MSITKVRQEYHNQVCSQMIRTEVPRDKGGYPNFADGSNASSVGIAWGIVEQLGYVPQIGKITPQAVGDKFENITRQFLEDSFLLLQHLRPGNWLYATKKAIADFEQYEHLEFLDNIIKQNHDLKSALGGDYIVKPDIVVGRYPVPDDTINSLQTLVTDDDNIVILTPLRERNRNPVRPILHASISCKWTIRSDRSQNTRTEALNLIRNRKGPLPHVVAVTAEPLPTRLAALALGTGDLDCVYHFALPELTQVIHELGNQDQLDMLNTLVYGSRLRDISDLVFDLAT